MIRVTHAIIRIKSMIIVIVQCIIWMKKKYTHVIKFVYLRINICSKIYPYKIKTNVFCQADNNIYYILSSFIEIILFFYFFPRSDWTSQFFLMRFKFKVGHKFWYQLKLFCTHSHPPIIFVLFKTFEFAFWLWEVFKM